MGNPEPESESSPESGTSNPKETESDSPTNEPENEPESKTGQIKEPLGKTFQAAPEASDKIQTTWENDPLQVVFLIYSIVVGGGILFLLQFAPLTYIFVLVLLYSLTTIPFLYSINEPTYFDKKENPFLEANREEQNQDNN